MNQPSKIKQASDKANAIDSETRAVLDSVARKNGLAMRWFMVSWIILFAIGVFGIYKQNQIAADNKKHIDCIVKLFTTPLPVTAHSRTISNASTTCNINFVQ